MQLRLPHQLLAAGPPTRLHRQTQAAPTTAILARYGSAPARLEYLGHTHGIHKNRCGRPPSASSSSGAARSGCTPTVRARRYVCASIWIVRCWSALVNPSVPPLYASRNIGRMVEPGRLPKANRPSNSLTFEDSRLRFLTRMPGSGEGIPRLFGYNMKQRDSNGNDIWTMVFTEPNAVLMIARTLILGHLRAARLRAGR